jgi:hypothetical protein
MVAHSQGHVVNSSELSLQVVGAGPAGMGLILALCNRIAAANEDSGLAQALLDNLVMFESGSLMGGKMARYQVNANTSAHDVVQGIKDGTPFVSQRDQYLQHPETQSRIIPLHRIGQLMVEPLAESMDDFLGARLHRNARVARIEASDNGFGSFDAEDGLLAQTQNLLFCCGAVEKPLPALQSFSECWEGSGKFLMRTCLDGLQHTRQPIVIIGASHSAFSCAWRLLYDPLFSEFSRDRGIVILKRREDIKLRCTPGFAAENRIDFDPQTDICPRTGVVFFNGGLRKDARALYLKIRDGEENRVSIVEIEQIEDQFDLLEQAGLVLQATGFAPNLPVIRRGDATLRVGNPSQRGELSNIDTGEVIPGLFGMGLGFNILPDGEPRGEPSFNGGIHGFQSYPLSIAPRVIDGLMARCEEMSN